MKKIGIFLSSMYFTGILLAIFAIAIGYATFIENAYGTVTAKILVYNSRWFEALLLLIAINLIASIIVNKMLTKKKWPVFLFHAAFLFIIAGAAITRYYGFEGTMHIREGESANTIISDATFIKITASYGGQTETLEKAVRFSGYTANRFNEKIKVNGKKIRIENLQFMPSASETISKDMNGNPILALMALTSEMQRIDFSLKSGSIKTIGGIEVGFDCQREPPEIHFTERNGEIVITAPDSLVQVNMTSNESKAFPPGHEFFVSGRYIYRYGGLTFVFKQYYQRGKAQLLHVPPENGAMLPDAFIAEITVDGEKGELTVSGEKGLVGEPARLEVNSVGISVSYGSKLIELPFSLALKDFQLERYPGSNSPSSYASEVVLADKAKGIEKPFRIFMNNILKYKGYRFFQSSYDTDEKGTILSVNHDQAGTMFTYFGYLIMAIGMVLTLFNRNSRFSKLAKASAKLRKQRQKLYSLIGISLFLVFSSNAQSADPEGRIDKTHVKAFGELLVQNNSGRIEPVNTLASDILRKVAKTNKLNGIPASEIFLDMHINPEKWKNIPLIKVANAELRKFLGTSEKLVNFNLIVTPRNQGGYKLSSLVRHAYGKKPIERTRFDKEVINVDERVNILMNVFNGNFLTITPVPDDPNDEWAAFSDLSLLNPEEAKIAEKTISNYFQAVRQSINSGDWQTPNRYLEDIKTAQARYAGHILPSTTKIEIEVFYYNFNIFGNLAKVYMVTGLFLLSLQLINLFNPKMKTGRIKKAGIVIAFLLFTFHTSGLAIRWYISGHAPWSNGYESMIFIGWATCLAGLIFINRSEITLSLTLVLSALTLFVAGMSWMSPEITNLMPVLKSYWLIVHVAVITASYGFLGICALLGLLNLVLLISRTQKNVERISLTIKELAYVIQMALIIGLFLLTIGSFLGGVWANESWGRYWGWDPKETWAMVTILVYSFIIHMHKIPGFKGNFALSTAAVVGFSSVLMTYFGVNYYLSGLHSYAQGEPAPVPAGVYIAIVLVSMLVISAYFSERKQKAKTSKVQAATTDIEAT